MEFLSRQMDQICSGGISVLLRKIATVLRIIFAVPPVILARIISPVIRMRFGAISTLRIGHFATNTELYLCERDCSSEKTLDLFYYRTEPACNLQLKTMWRRVLFISSFVQWLETANRLLPGGEKHSIESLSSTGNDRDNNGLFGECPPHLSFTPEEEQKGKDELRNMGVNCDVPFVCFHARDSLYLEKMFPDKNYHYHDHRDADINSYIPAVRELAQRGYFAIRMGAVIKDELKISDQKIIDYASICRTEFMDIYLGAKCQFFVGDTAGIYSIPRIFRRPIVYINTIPLEYLFATKSNTLVIPKKLWAKRKKRFLTFREILDSGIGRYLESRLYERAELEVVENTPEEILSVTVEMEERLKGTWQPKKEDEELQIRFWSLFKPSELNQVFRARIGAEFLRQNRELLE